MPHKVLIDALLCSHTENAQIRAQQVASNDLDQQTPTAAIRIYVRLNPHSGHLYTHTAVPAVSAEPGSAALCLSTV